MREQAMKVELERKIERIAREREKAELLQQIQQLQFKADVNARDSKGDTPLHYAGWFEKPKVAKILVETGGADVHAKNNAGKEPENAESPECVVM